MVKQIEQCQDCQHKINSSLDRAEFWHCRAFPDNPALGGANILDFRYCEVVRRQFPICPHYVLKLQEPSLWQRIKQFFSRKSA